jgi:Ca2+-binding EF-hand superfamily protein
MFRQFSFAETGALLAALSLTACGRPPDSAGHMEVPSAAAMQAEGNRAAADKRTANVFARLDLDRNSKLSFSEYKGLGLMAAYRHGSDTGELTTALEKRQKEAFVELDKNGDTSLTRQEFAPQQIRIRRGVGPVE